jgi:hypothetical protein
MRTCWSKPPMPCEVDYLPQHDIVVFTHTGHTSLHDVKDHSKLLTSLLQQTHASRLLLDYSEAILDIPAKDLATLPDYYTGLGAPQDRKIANVVPKSGDNVHAAIYHQILARKQGYHLTLFSTKDQAMQWLKEGLTS